MVEGVQTDRGIPVREIVPLKAMRKMAAEHLAKSHAQVAAVTSLGEVDVTDLVALRQRLAAEPERTGGVRLTYTPLLVKALAQALTQHPSLNAALAEEVPEIRVYAEVNIGVAVALPDGNLIVPVVHQADHKTLADVAMRVTDLTDRARKGALTPEDVRRGTFTLSNVGMVRGVGWSTPLVPLPQAAILGTGRIEPKPAVRNGAIVIRAMLPISLTWDHRIVNGVPVGQFLEALTDLLEHPKKLDLGI
ncbi:MAG TPA: 2-oxo acid dehydrogenase subunit E2 [Candidatus Methylomirabilis sp.]|nr:2-oxo acid dehydrogenase subunit E2 [Candidatus Methylomirabilis sp.]